MAREIINILLVEDDEAHAEAVRRAFQEKAGSGVGLTWASSLKEALASLNESIPDLVITDWLLPDGKGTDILRSDKELFPVVLITSHGNEQIAVEAMKAGVMDYVVKSALTFADMPHTADRALRQWNLIIERKRAEEKLRESEERFRTVFEQGPFGIHIAGLDYRFVAANAAFCRTIGYSEEELNELTFMDITYLKDREMDMVQAEKLLNGEMQYYKMEKRSVTKAGEVVWMDFTRSVIRNAGGKPLYFLTMVQDITDRKQSEHVLKRTLSDLTRSNADLEQFAYVASHDLQEPLRNVANCMQMLEKTYKARLGADADQLIHYAVDSVKRMKALIQDLLTFSRIATKGKPFHPTNTDEILQESLMNLDAAIAETTATITHDPLPTVHADATQLLQVFQNVIANSLKFHRDESPRVHVSAARNGNEWVFSVKDNGIGIESRHLDRIFIIFQRLNKRADYQGTGMGLAIVKKVVERHRGRVWVESEPGVGTTFYFTIPEKAIQI